MSATLISQFKDELKSTAFGLCGSRMIGSEGVVGVKPIFGDGTVGFSGEGGTIQDILRGILDPEGDGFAIITAPANSTRNTITPTADAINLSLKSFTGQTVAHIRGLDESDVEQWSISPTGRFSILAGGGMFSTITTQRNMISRNSNGLIIGDNAGWTGVTFTTPTSTSHEFKVGATTRLSISDSGIVVSGSTTTTTLTVTGNSSLQTITSGLWNGTVIGATYGGTGQTVYAVGDMLYASTTTALSKRTIGSAGDFLKVSGGLPVWAAMTLGEITTALGYTPVNKAGDTMTGFLIANADPTIGLHYATKQYVDAAATGLKLKIAVVAATTGNITLSGTQTIDTVAVIAGDRVLVKSQTAPEENGIYIVAAGAWSRSTDCDTGAELVGAITFVSGGSANDFTQWAVSTTGTITLGTTAVDWILFFAGADLTFSSPLQKIGSTVSVITNGISNTLIRQSAALSVIGRASNSTGDVADISTTAASGAVLRESGSTIGWGTVATAGITNGAITLAKQANLAANSIIGNNTGSAATPLALTASEVKTLLSLNLVENTALSTWWGTTNIITLGTITSGTWNGTTIAANRGGTGNSVYAVGDILIATSTTALSRLASNATATRMFLRTVSAGLPIWDQVTTTDISGLAAIATSGSASDLIVGTLPAGRFPSLTGAITTVAGALATTLAVNIVGNTNLRDSSALSLIGRSANTVGDPADITASAGSGAVMRESGSVIGWGTIATAGITDNAVTIGKMAQIVTSSFLGRSTASTGNVEVLTVATAKTLLNLTGTNSGDQTITLTSDVTGSGIGSFATTITAGAVTLAKMAALAANSIIGNNTGISATPIALTTTQVKTMLNLTGTNSGDQTITLTGPVTGSGTGSFATTITNNAVTLAKIEQVPTSIFLGRSTALTGNVEMVGMTAARTMLGLGTSNSPTFSELTLSGLSPLLPLFTNASSRIVTNPMTGSGSVVMSTSPTLAGTIIAAAMTMSSVMTHNAQAYFRSATPNGAINGAASDRGVAVFGPAGSQQIQIDGDEIQSMNNVTPATLYVNYHGGDIRTNNTSGGLSIGPDAAPVGLLDVRSRASVDVIASFGTTSTINPAYPGYIYFSQTNCINSGYNVNGNAELAINYVGYLNGSSQYRDLSIQDGKNAKIAFFDGSTHRVIINNNITDDGVGRLQVNGSIGSNGNAFYTNASYVTSMFNSSPGDGTTPYFTGNNGATTDIRFAPGSHSNPWNYFRRPLHIGASSDVAAVGSYVSLMLKESASSTWIQLDKDSSSYECGLMFFDNGIIKWYNYLENDSNHYLQWQSSAAPGGENDSAPRMRFSHATRDIWLAGSGGKVRVGNMGNTADYSAILQVVGGLKVTGTISLDGDLITNSGEVTANKLSAVYSLFASGIKSNVASFNSSTTLTENRLICSFIGPCTLTLPPASGSSSIYFITRQVSFSGTAAIATTGADSIVYNGSSFSTTSLTQGQWVMVAPNGANTWLVIAS